MLPENEHVQALRTLERIAALMDERFRIPGTGFRVGLDGLLGLIPGVGDAATALVSLYLLHQAHRLGARGPLLARMVGNVAVDALLGSVPVVGDLFDFGFKANRRNVELLRRHLQRVRPPAC